MAFVNYHPYSSAKKKKELAALCILLVLLFIFLIIALFRLSPDTNRSFSDFTRQLTCSELRANTLNLHYTLADPDAFGIRDYPITLGSCSETTFLSGLSSAENALSCLKQFDKSSLSLQHQLTYDILEASLNTTLTSSGFYLYDEPLSPSLGVQAQLPILLAEYTFRTRTDIEDYLSLLEAVPAYFRSIIIYEQQKAEKGLFMNNSCAQAVLEQCDAFLSSGKENYLKSVFDEQIRQITNLSQEEKQAYLLRHDDLLNTCIFPSYRSLMNTVARLLGSRQYGDGLCRLPNGSDYYTWLLHSVTGDNASVEEIEHRIKQQIISDSQSIKKILNSCPDLSTASLTTDTAEASPEEILSELQNMIKEDFPAAPDVSVKVNYVHESLSPYLSPAFYLVPPIDNWSVNTIYLNPASEKTPLDTYATLAHEGYPGHLYQTIYFESKNQEPLRSILNFKGYTEGWATYVEMYSYSTWKQDAALASLYQKDRSLILGLASLLDIGIHYRGYSLSQISAFLSHFGITEENAAVLYRQILEEPANYPAYFVGYLNFTELKDRLSAAPGERFTLKEFHTRVLEIGPCDFSILRHYLTEPSYFHSLL